MASRPSQRGGSAPSRAASGAPAVPRSSGPAGAATHAFHGVAASTPSPSPAPATPQGANRAKPSRPKTASNRSKASPSVPKRVAGATVPVPSTISSAVAGLPATTSSNSRPATEGATPGTTNASNKRARPSSMTGQRGLEPEPKRTKPIAGAAAVSMRNAAARSAVAAAAAAAAAANSYGSGAVPAVGAPHQTGVALDTSRAPPPPSPTTSRSRRRPSARSKPAADQDALSSSSAVAAPGNHTLHGAALASAAAAAASGAVHGTALATAGAAALRNRQTGAGVQSVPPTSHSLSGSSGGRRAQRVMQVPQPSSYLSLEGLAMPGNLRTTTPVRRLFGHEIQSLMHAFGAVRYGSRDVLEYVEDFVREQVRAVAFDAAARVHDTADRTGIPAKVEGSAIVLSTSSVVQCLQKDPRAVFRLNRAMELSSASKQDSSVEQRLRRRVRAYEGPVDIVRELALMPDASETREHVPERYSAAQDLLAQCMARTETLVKLTMSKAQMQDILNCRSVSFVRQESRSRAPAVRGRPRAALFREWLGIRPSDHIVIPDDVLCALGHIAWEVVGSVTQAALMYKHFQDLELGLCDPCAHNWSFGRHLLASLGHGIITSVLLPLSERQVQSLRNELEFLIVASHQQPLRWKGFGGKASSCLLPHHVREVVRRSDQSFSFACGAPPIALHFSRAMPR